MRVTSTPTLYSVQPGPKYDQLTVESVWSQSGEEPLAAGYAHLVPVTVGGQTYLLGIDASGKGSWFAASASAPWLAQVDAGIDLGKAYDIVNPFVLGNVPYLLAYAAKEGDFAFFPIGPDLSLQPPYPYARHHEPAISKDFDVAQPIVINGEMFILCYGFKTGLVNIYSLSVTSVPMPGAAPGTPPLQALPVWWHQWARDWTRFAFFTLGAENFFLKTNVGKLNVNIDHVLDDPSQGTVEVATYLNMENALRINLVRAFYMGGGDPHFVNYVNDGSTTFYRFRSDCQGWTKQASLSSIQNATQIAPYRLGGQTFVLVY